MPELPEVETVSRGLANLIVGKKVKGVSNDNPKSFPNPDEDVKQFLIGSTITGVRRRAKVLMIDLSTGYSLMAHLKMTGQLVFVAPGKDRFGAGHPSDSLVGELPDKSTRVVITFGDDSHLYFNDQRKFGWIRLMPTEEIKNTPFMQKVGPEPLDDSFLSENLAERLSRKKKSNIKAALLDQTVVAGIGNIYADEALWGAKIHPKRLVGSLTKQELTNLYTEIRAVLNLSIQKGGSTNKNYVNAEGKRGSYMDFARVFRREGQSCSRCQSEIQKIRVAGRGTHICPHCQVL